jgi:hypothetical protein
MINFYNQVPSIYPSASRDFQYLSWLINIVLNSVKHNVDDIYNLPNNQADPKLTELLAMTLGFKVKRNYDQKQLAALASIIPSLLKHKGTLTAVDMACKALITASGSTGTFMYEVKDEGLLEVLLPENLVDITLFMDLLPYILPAGMTCRIIRKQLTRQDLSTEVLYDDRLYAKWVKDLSWKTNSQETTGLANLFDTGRNDLGAQSLASYSDDKGTVNTGLLDNSVIPILNPNEDILYDENFKQKEGE